MRKWKTIHRPSAIETLESRRLMSATPTNLSLDVLSTTLPSSVVAGIPVHGAVTIGVTNLATTKSTGSVTLAVYAVHPNGVINSSTALIVSATKNLSIPPSGAVIFTLNVNAFRANLASGTYGLLAQTTDSFRHVATSPIGPGISVAAPFVRFSETELANNLPTTAVADTVTPAIITVNMTNTGNIAPSKPTLVDIYASTNGTVDDNSVLIGGVSRNLRIKPGDSATIPVRLGSFPNVPTDTYDLIAQVIDQNGDTTAAPAAVSVVISPPFIALTDQLIIPTVSFSHANSKGIQTITANCVVKMTNDGNGISSGSTMISLYLSTTNSAAGIFTPVIKTVAPNLTIKPRQMKTITFRSTIPPTQNDTPVYFVAKITDPDGNVTYGINPTPHDLFA
jgi:hypothetical protein